MNFARFFRPAHIPALLIMGALFYFSSQPGTSIPMLRPPLDKVLHFIAYFVLGASFCLWIRGARWQKRPWPHLLLVLLACAVFGLTDEFHQSFVPGRSVSLGDLLADLCGSLIAALLYMLTRFYRFADRVCFSLRPFGLVLKESLPEK